MNSYHFRPASCALLILLIPVLFLNACSSSDDADPVLPPAPVPLMIDDLAATAGGNTSVTLAWTSPQLSDKQSIRYDLRYIAFGSEGTDWDAWTVATAPGPDAAPGQARTNEVTGLTSGQVYTFGMKAGTDGFQWSAISNLAVATAAPVFDTTAPAAVTGLLLYKSTATSLTVVWPPAGDDGLYGQAQSYEVRYATEPITPAGWDTATPAPGGIAPSALPDMMETTITGLTADQEYHVAVVAIDDMGLKSGLSNVVAAATVDLRTIYVNVEGTGDYPSIGSAIRAATAGDLILVGPGRYTWTNQATGDSLFGLIYVPRDFGDFEVRSIAGPEATILDAEKHARVMLVTGGAVGDPEDPESVGITITGFTFVNGRANATVSDGEEGYAGGGLALHYTDTIVRDCIFKGNEATEGGGLWCGGTGGATIENCLFEDNSSDLGGGILLVNSIPRVTVRDCVLRRNHARKAGGGIFAVNITVTMEDLLVVENSSTNKGGGISLSGLHPDGLLIRCTVAGNRGILGSAIRLIDNMTIRIENSLLAYNTGGPAFSTAVYSGVEIGCSLIYGHELGNQMPTNTLDLGGNMETNPLFCDQVDYMLQANSPCLGGACVIIGARGVGCGI